MEKPILFNTQMVKAILSGSKTQTRRLIKPQPPCALKKMTEGHHTGEWHLYRDSPMMNPIINSPWGAQYLPPCQIGDMLWVRETWQYIPESDSDGFYTYAADCEEPADWKWRPSIHMPKEAARLFLRVKNVRVERLQDMSEEDAISEGYSGVCPGAHTVYFSDGYAEPCHVGGEDCRYGYWYCNHSIQEAFGRDIWDKTIKPSDLQRYGWDANPWVWMIEFERLNGDFGDIKEK